MAENSKIEWTHATFNAWRGCDKVSPGCDHCYAETLSGRNPAVLGIWGKDGTRPVAAESYWRQPEKWNRQAEAAGERRRVFCLSLGDVFENRPDLRAPRLRLFDLIRRTPHLDWLLLTKRPKNIKPLIHGAWEWGRTTYPADPTPHISRETWEDGGLGDWFTEWMSGAPPHNVWLGTSVEDQVRARERVPALLSVPAAVRFLSMEPLLGPVDLRNVELRRNESPGEPDRDFALFDTLSDGIGDARVDWVIVGGESGPGARPMHPDWARSLRDQCNEAGVAFFFKQWGEWQEYEPRPGGDLGGDLRRGVVEHVCADRESDGHFRRGDTYMRRVGKHASGRLLDGRTWDEVPTPVLA